MNKEMREYRIGHQIAAYDIADGAPYASKWGVTDFYPACEKNLRLLIKQKEDFMTTDCGSKKELVSARFSRHDGVFHVNVSAWMDDLWESTDLIEDALYDVAKDEVDNWLEDDEFIDLVRDMAYESDIDDCAGVHEMLAAYPTYEQVVEVAGILEKVATGNLQKTYDALKDIVRECISICSIAKEQK